MLLIQRTAFDFLHEDEIKASIEANCSEQFKRRGFMDGLAEMCFRTILSQTSLSCETVASYLLTLARNFDFKRASDALYMDARQRCESIVLEHYDFCCSCRYSCPRNDGSHWSLTISDACFRSDLRRYPLVMLDKFPLLAFTRGNNLVRGFQNSHLAIWLSLKQKRKQRRRSWSPLAQLSLSVLEKLLEVGCEPNVDAWSAFVGGFAMLEHDAAGEDKIAAIMLLMLESGADPTYVVRTLCPTGNQSWRINHQCQPSCFSETSHLRTPKLWHALLSAKLAEAYPIPTREYRARRQRLRAIKVMRALDAIDFNAVSVPRATYHLALFREFLYARFPRLDVQYTRLYCDSCGHVPQAKALLRLDCIDVRKSRGPCASRQPRRQGNIEVPISDLVGFTPVQEEFLGDIRDQMYRWYEVNAAAHGVVEG